MNVKSILIVMRGHDSSNRAIQTLMNLIFLLELLLSCMILRPGLQFMAWCSGSKDAIMDFRGLAESPVNRMKMCITKRG